MAIGRYHEFGVTDPQANFFKLDYQMLAQPVLKRDEEYKQTQAAYDQYLQQLSSQEVHPKDIPGLMGRISKIQEEEKRLREQVSGDLTSPLYQEKIRDIFTNTMKDPWYRQAAFQYQRYQDWDKFSREYVLRTGDYPESWQDPASGYWSSYAGVDKTKDLAPAGIIEPVIPYTNEATKFAENAVKSKIQSSEWKVVNKLVNGEQRPFLEKKDSGAVTSEEIKDVIRLSSEWGTNSKGYFQLQKRFESTPELQKQWGTFDNFYENSVLKSIGDALGYAWEEVKVSPLAMYEGTGDNTSSDTKVKGSKLDEFRTGPYLEHIPAGVNPVGYPDYKTATAAFNFYSQAAGEMENGFKETITGPDGRPIVRQVKPIVDRAYDAFGVDKNNTNGIKFSSAVREGSEEKTLSITYKNKQGQERTVPLDKLLAYANELPAELAKNIDKGFMQMTKEFADLQALRHQAGQIETLKQNIGVAVYGPERWGKINKEGFRAVLSDSQRRKLDNDPLVYQARVLQDAILNRKPLTKELLRGTGDWTSVTIPGYTPGVTSGSAIASKADTIKNFKVLGEAMGIPIDQWYPEGGIQPDDAIDNFVRIVNQSRRGNTGINLSIDNNFVRRIEEPVAVDIAIGGGDNATKSFMTKWKENWTHGLDEKMQPRFSGEGVTHGVKQASVVMFAPNTDTTSGNKSSELFWKNMTKLVDGVTSQIRGKDSDQDATASKIMLYNSETNAAAKENDYLLFQGGAEVYAISLGDEGWTMQVRPKGKTGLYEIRDQQSIIDAMVNSGMGSQVVFQLVHNMSKQFNDFDNNIDRPQPDFTAGTQTTGQARSRSAISTNTKVSTDVGMDLYRPVERLESDVQTANGLQKAGTYRYFSLSKDQYIYSPNLVKIGEEMMIDRYTLFNLEANETTRFTTEDFDNRITFAPEVMQNNVVNTRLKQFIVDDIVADADSPEKLHMNSATRNASHALSIANPTSPHINSRAVDFDVNLNSEAQLEFWARKAAEAKQKGVKVALEFPSTSHPKYRELKDKYGDLVELVQHATGTHIHIEN